MITFYDYATWGTLIETHDENFSGRLTEAIYEAIESVVDGFGDILPHYTISSGRNAIQLGRKLLVAIRGNPLVVSQGADLQEVEKVVQTLEAISHHMDSEGTNTFINELFSGSYSWISSQIEHSSTYLEVYEFMSEWSDVVGDFENLEALSWGIQACQQILMQHQKSISQDDFDFYQGALREMLDKVEPHINNYQRILSLGPGKGLMQSIERHNKQPSKFSLASIGLALSHAAHNLNIPDASRLRYFCT